MNLYEIDSNILDCVDEETGEIFDVDKFEELSIERDAKIENICLWIKNLNAEVEALKAEKDAFTKREKSAKNKMESLKKYISGYLDGNKFETSKVKVSFRKSEQLEVDDYNLLPDEFLRFKEPEPNKDAIKAALKEGKVLEGVSVVTKYNIQIK